MLLDEVAQLGEMEALEKGVTVLRGYGVRFWYIIQSLSQLEVAYPGARYKTLLASFPIQQFFGISDPETAKYVSAYIGKETAASPNFQGTTTTSTTGGPNSSRTSGTSQGTSYGAIEKDLVKPEEVLRCKGVIILRQGEQAILASRLTYYSDPEYSDKPGSRAVPPCWASKLLCALGVALALSYLPFLGSLAFRRSSDEAAPAVGSSPAPEPASRVTTPVQTQAQGRPTALSSPPTIPSMPVTLPLAECPGCGVKATYPRHYSGQRIKCNECDTRFVLPYSTH
jgi:type IV secretion system protein VirD4